MESRTHPLDRALPRVPRDISLSTYALLFSEVVRYTTNRVNSVPELEQKLAVIGRRVGVRLVEVMAMRDRTSRRRIKIHDVLAFLQTNLWRTLFGKPADLLEQVTSDVCSYMLSDHDMLVNKFISISKEYGDLNCAAFVGGIVEAAVDGMGFPAEVAAHTVEGKGTTLLIKFDHTKIPQEAL
ncbi:hypothetical protein PTSG_04852 [Salpingoeca rosetta]|uniref:Trafficking protein particle complex subunit n=1 Tax=Salpingoeca rosetta (strain ATCC 50818 / BSB-021) TaxID=946362 RepID=F2U9W2_SALR5|nr:uncharacterized protein PTSG_04852 [Salpingoeca rosetta]EGD73139.1 hypothetical protein PTSG_04852 [Salpingoeca rosetta]|eukprot:XP_004994170.1 hypothetical protein PTSG_04852 [Salpingoeca rosetta]